MRWHDFWYTITKYSMKTFLLRHHACCQWSCWLLAALALQLTARADQVIYDDALENSWQNWSYSTTVNLNNTGTYVHTGSASISATITSGWGALSLWHSAQDSSGFTNLTFWINGGASGGQQLQIYAEVTGATEPAISMPTLAAGWQQMNFSLS